MKKMLAVVVLMVGVAIGFRAFHQGATVSGPTFTVDTGKPYVDYQDLRNRKLPYDGFSMKGYKLESDNTLDLSFYTHGKPDDNKLIEPTIERVKYLTQNLSKQYPIHIVFVDGNPFVKMNGVTEGTGVVIREIDLPVTE
ncbi:MAG: hypothetical protein WCC16_12715 [Candidatus Sulfotelmatobacter sp.]